MPVKKAHKRPGKQRISVRPEQNVTGLAGKIKASKILDILGGNCFAEFTAVKAPGTVIWCNFELAEDLGFDVPPSSRMTKQFHRQLVDALSYRVLPAHEAARGRQTITLYADRYGGDGLGGTLGAGRAGFLPYGNLYLKGVGLTPLFKRADQEDFPHSHGGVQMNDCLGEAVFGEVNQHLLTQGSTRILAIIDQGEFIVYPDGFTVPIALVVRGGMQLRPGHLLSGQVRRNCSLLEIFKRITLETGQLITRSDRLTSGEIPDIKATMLRILDDHAQTVAELYRWRMIHGAVTSSNMEMSGAMLDLTSQTSQPRTAPICFLLEDDSFFGREHIERALQLQMAYRSLVRSLSRQERRLLNARSFNLVAEMRKAYWQHLQIQLLCAAGLKQEVAELIRTKHADIAYRFSNTIARMCELRNQGNLEMARGTVEKVSVLDVFTLLRIYPASYFADTAANHTKIIRAALKPTFKGNRFHVRKKRGVVTTLIKQFALVYRELMETCESEVKEFYRDASGMRVSITARAAFENEPLKLYRTELYREFDEAIQQYKSSRDVESFRKTVGERIYASMRKVDALLGQGKSRRMNDGGLELEMRTIDGINYSVKAWADRKQTRQLQVSMTVKRVGKYYVTPLLGQPHLTKRQIPLLRYHFTIDNRVDEQMVGARLSKDATGHWVILCDPIENLPPIGRLEGIFSLCEGKAGLMKDGEVKLSGYTFAVPDRHELMKLFASRTPDSGMQTKRRK
jgi:hypothetical protein